MIIGGGENRTNERRFYWGIAFRISFCPSPSLFLCFQDKQKKDNEEEKDMKNQDIWMQLKKYDIYVGVDPDKDNSGVAVYDKRSNTIEMMKYTFPEMVKYINHRQHVARQTGVRMIVVIEASWLVGDIRLHAKWTDNKGITARKGYAVGYNHAVGKLLKEMLDDMEISNLEQHPLRKTWNGPERKITRDELEYMLDRNRTKYRKGVNNQEMRDAALLALYHTNFIFCKKTCK